MGILLVVRLGGTLNVRSNAAEAMRRLGLHSKFSATLVGDDASTRGMLRVAATSLAWSKVEAAMVARLIEGRARLPGGRKPATKDFQSAGFKDHNDLAQKLAAGETKWSEVRGFVHVFRLSPPRGGYPRPANRLYGAGGLMGENPELPKLVERMI